MSKYKIHDGFMPHFLTCTVVEWIDALTRPEYKNIIIDSLDFCRKHKGLAIHGYVIMTNHIHLIATATGTIPLNQIMTDFKKWTGSQLIKAIANNERESRKWMLAKFSFNALVLKHDREHQFWQHGNGAKELSTLPFTLEKLAYIHNNPVKQGWIKEPEHYLYSSASNYVTGEGLIEIDMFDIPRSMVGYVRPTGI